MGDQATRIYVISDSTGETARRVVKSALVQFDRPELEVVSFARVRQADEIEAVFK